MSGQQADELRRALAERRQRLTNAFGQKNGVQRDSGRSRGAVRVPGSGSQQPRLDPSKPGHLSQQVDPDGTAGGSSPRGSASALEFGNPADMDPERLQFEPLPKGQGGEAEELYGLRAANPRVKPNPISPGTGTGAAAGDQAPGPGAAPMLPKNRALIERYFDSKR